EPRPPGEERNLQPDGRRVAVPLLRRERPAEEVGPGASAAHHERRQGLPPGNGDARVRGLRSGTGRHQIGAFPHRAVDQHIEAVGDAQRGVVSGGSATSYATFAGSPIESANAPRVVWSVPSIVSRVSWTWESAVFAWSTSAMVASPTRWRCSAASRFVCASFSVVCWAARSALVAWYWKYAVSTSSTTF